MTGTNCFPLSTEGDGETVDEYEGELVTGEALTDWEVVLEALAVADIVRRAMRALGDALGEGASEGLAQTPQLVPTLLTVKELGEKPVAVASAEAMIVGGTALAPSAAWVAQKSLDVSGSMEKRRYGT